MTRRRSALKSRPSPRAPDTEAIAKGLAAALEAERALADGSGKDVASPAALRQIREQLSRLRIAAAAPLLYGCMEALEAGRFAEAQELAMQATEQDENNGFAWKLVAICREKQRDYLGALHCFDRASKLLPDADELALDLGRLAFMLQMPEMAEKFFARYLAVRPGNIEAVNNLAGAYRMQSRFSEATELLRTFILAHPEQALLWNSLGAVLAEQGDNEQAIVFYQEALRLRPGFHTARHNLANSLGALGDPQGGVVQLRQALSQKDPDDRERTTMRFSLACLLLMCGEVADGWETYEAREEPHYVDLVQFAFEGERWAPGDDIAGKRLLVVGEQGLGDEVMFANLLPDVVEDLGPDGELALAVEHRLVPLFQRSFPKARVVRHSTYNVNRLVIRGAHIERESYDTWTRLGTLLRSYRRSVEAFPARSGGFLKADPERIDHWRSTLAGLGAGPKVGVLWKSLKMNAARQRYFSPFEQWRPVLATPGVTFVNLQYGECAEELARAKAEFGIDIVQPPGIDLKEDLDDLAALCVGLDLVIGPATATTNIAAACGADTWFVSTPDAWPRLGTNFYPWYAQARVFAAANNYNWAEVMERVAATLRETYPA